MLLYKMKQSNSPFVVTFSGFICIDMWLASRESRKIFSPAILVSPLSILKSVRKTGVSVNNKGGVLLFDRILPFDILVWQSLWQTGSK